jgi:uncharacterized membrane protein (UPF0127 family)
MRNIKFFEEFASDGPLVGKVGKVKIYLHVPSTDDEKQKGYMFSDGPKDGEGMLFVYPKEEVLTFWMKNVSVPLDILFFDSSLNLIDYKTMFPYEGNDEVYYHSDNPAKFAIEVPYGWIDENLDPEDCKLSF